MLFSETKLESVSNFLPSTEEYNLKKNAEKQENLQEFYPLASF